jgi:hypothetical protein
MANRLLIMMLLIGGVAAWGQAPKEASSDAEKAGKVDKATAYYHYMLACMYANRVDGPADPDKVRENLEAARKADPQAPTVVPPYVRPALPYLLAPIPPPPPAKP